MPPKFLKLPRGRFFPPKFRVLVPSGHLLFKKLKSTRKPGKVSNEKGRPAQQKIRGTGNLLFPSAKSPPLFVGYLVRFSSTFQFFEKEVSGGNKDPKFWRENRPKGRTFTKIVKFPEPFGPSSNSSLSRLPDVESPKLTSRTPKPHFWNSISPPSPSFLAPKMSPKMTLKNCPDDLGNFWPIFGYFWIPKMPHMLHFWSFLAQK